MKRPPGVAVEVRDYDVEGAHPETLIDDDEGNRFVSLNCADQPAVLSLCG